MNQAEQQHNLERGLVVLEQFCNDPAWLIRLWKTIPRSLGHGFSYVETTEGAWYQGLEQHVKGK